MPKISEENALVRIEIDYDIRSIENIEISFDLHATAHIAYSYLGYGKSYAEFESENLSKATRFARRTYYSYHVKSIDVHFTRHMTNEKCQNWPARRNTGFNISWYHLDTEKVQPTYFYREENQHFITLSNVIHEQQGVSEDMMELIKDMKEDKKIHDSCKVGYITSAIRNLISERYENISQQPTYLDVITEDTLDMAAEIYFGISFCPDFDHGTVDFYEQLFQHFSLETILKTLARILFVSNEHDLSQHYITVKGLFEKVSTEVRLQYRDIAVLTTQAAKLGQYQELNNHQIDQQIVNGKLSRRIINWNLF